MNTPKKFILFSPDKTVSLRRRLRYPMVSLGNSVNFAGVSLRIGVGVQEQKVLGADVELEIRAFDETNTNIRPDKIAALIKKQATKW
jgi:hypothetical protein